MPKPWWETDFDPMQHLIKAENDIQQLSVNFLELVRAHNSLAESLDQQSQLLQQITAQHERLLKSSQALVKEITELKQPKQL
jgi:TnpA family transposase